MKSKEVFLSLYWFFSIFLVCGEPSGEYEFYYYMIYYIVAIVNLGIATKLLRKTQKSKSKNERH